MSAMSDHQELAVGAPEDRPSKKKRIHLNCKECRRTKTRCDRNWPCSNCVAKGLAASCPNGVLNTNRAKKETIAILEAKILALEGQLRRYGFQPETSVSYGDDGDYEDGEEAGAGGPDDVKPGEDELSAIDMASKLSEMLIHPSSSDRPSKRPAGAEATVFYYPSPEASSDEDTPESMGQTENSAVSGADRRGESKTARQDVWQDGLEWIPWGRSGKATRGSKSHLPRGRLMDRCRIMLPSRAQAEAAFEVFWEELTWRVQPINRTLVLSHILPAVYDDSDSVHPHDLALLFAIMALSILFDNSPDADASKSSELNERATAFHELSYACLTAGNFYVDITPASIATIHLLSIFLVNGNEGSAPDGLNAFITLGVRLAVQAGYHREVTIKSAVKDLPDPEFEANLRRRAFYELVLLERVHCMAWLLPASINSNNFDTLMPTDAPVDGYTYFMWCHNRLTARMVEYWTVSPTPPYSALIAIDNDIRSLVSGLPPSLQGGPSAAGLDSGLHSTYLLDGQEPKFEKSGNRSKYSLAEQYLLLLFNLHRPLFVQSMITGVAHQYSMDTVVDMVRRTVHMVDEIISLDVGNKWFSFPAVLFAVLHCQTALIIKTSAPSLFPDRIRLLERGVKILTRAAAKHSNPRTRGMLHGAKRLLRAAQESVSRASASPAPGLLSPPTSEGPQGDGGGVKDVHAKRPGERRMPVQSVLGLPTDVDLIGSDAAYPNPALSGDAPFGYNPSTQTARIAPPVRAQKRAAPTADANSAEATSAWWDDYAIHTTGQDSLSLQRNHPSPSRGQQDPPSTTFGTAGAHLQANALEQGQGQGQQQDQMFMPYGQFVNNWKIPSQAEQHTAPDPNSTLGSSDALPTHVNPASLLTVPSNTGQQANNSLNDPSAAPTQYPAQQAIGMARAPFSPGDITGTGASGLPQMADFEAWLESLTEELTSAPNVSEQGPAPA